MRKTKAQPRVIPLCVPHMGKNEAAYLKECITSNWVSYVGPFVSRFESRVANYVGVPHAVATNSGTAALHTALLVAGIQPDEEVLVPDLTFIAPVNAVRYCGAYPVFMDVEADYGQIDPSKIRRFLSTECEQKDGILINKQSGRHVRAMIPVHLLGHPCDMDPLMKLAKQYNLLVIEDASQSLGAVYKGKRVGSIGDIGCFSFNGNKIITTGGGGMLTTRHAAWAARAVYLTTQARDSATEFTHDTIGYNYRLTNIQAAVGLAQMEQLDAYIRIKHRIAKRYEAALRSVCGFTLPKQAPWAQSTDWLFTVRVDPDRFGMTCSQLRDALERQQIQTRTLWAPIHQQKPYRQCQTYEIDIAEKLYHTALSLPCSVGLTQKDQDRVIQAIKTIEKGKAKLARP